ncbi:MAG: alpha/beta hydrolase [Proteobacteria bacterium]|nr:alpha/beta hydrolase [Pseudomonadota bacterium]
MTKLQASYGNMTMLGDPAYVPGKRMRVLIIFVAAVIGVVILLIAANWWLARSTETAMPPLGKFAEIGGSRVHYVVRGEGPPIVLIHGANGALQDFTATIFDRLAAKYRVIAIDRPGHGYSERTTEAVTLESQAATLHTLLNQLDVEQPVVVGFSFGAAVALAYALDYPEETGAVVTLAGAAYEWPGAIDWKWKMPTWPIIGGFLANNLPQVVGRLIRAAAIRGAFSPDPVAAQYDNAPYGLMLRPVSFWANAADIRNLKSLLRAQSPRYPSLTVPLVILAGDGDSVVSNRVHSLRLNADVPHSELTLLRRAGHLLPYSRPDDAVAAIERGVERRGRK